MIYSFLADLVLVLHLALVCFNVGGFVVTWAGYFLKWPFVRNFWFRAAHLVSMGIVALQAVGGLFCPLTVWEDRLRELAGQSGRYRGSFIAYWLHRILFFDLPPRAFTVTYVAFFLLIVLTFVIVPPRPPKRLRARAITRDSSQT